MSINRAQVETFRRLFKAIEPLLGKRLPLQIEPERMGGIDECRTVEVEDGNHVVFSVVAGKITGATLWAVGRRVAEGDADLWSPTIPGQRRHVPIATWDADSTA